VSISHLLGKFVSLAQKGGGHNTEERLQALRNAVCPERDNPAQSQIHTRTTTTLSDETYSWNNAQFDQLWQIPPSSFY